MHMKKNVGNIGTRVTLLLTLITTHSRAVYVEKTLVWPSERCLLQILTQIILHANEGSPLLSNFRASGNSLWMIRRRPSEVMLIV